MPDHESKIEFPQFANKDPLAILAEAGVDVMNLSPDAREVFDRLSSDEARLLAKVNRRLESVTELDINSKSGPPAGGLNH
jgi:hypothetical protein